MRFEVDAAEMASALAHARQALTTTPERPVQAAVQVAAEAAGALNVRGAGPNGEISCRVPGADVEEGGVAVVPPRAVETLLRNVEGRVAVTVDGARMTVERAGRRSYRFKLVEEEYPPEMRPGSGALKLDPDALRRAVASVRHAVNTDTSALHLAAEDGVLTLTTTDGYRLATADLPVTGEGRSSGVVPFGVFERAARDGAAAVAIAADGVVHVGGSGRRTAIRALSVPFPAVGGVLTRVTSGRAEFDADEATGALRRAVSVGGDRPLTVRLEGGAMTVEVENTDVGSGSEDIAITGASGGDVVLMIRGEYLRSALESCTGRVTMRWTAAGEAVHLDAADGGRHVVMPLRT